MAQNDQAGYDALAKIEELVHHIWDAMALMCLETRPLRYSELHRTIATSTGQHLSESELTRTRHRLVRHRMIREGPGENGRKVYAITAAGRARLRQIRVLVQIAPQLDTPDTEQPPDRTDDAYGVRRPPAAGAGWRR